MNEVNLSTLGPTDTPFWIPLTTCVLSETQHFQKRELEQRSYVNFSKVGERLYRLEENYRYLMKVTSVQTETWIYNSMLPYIAQC